MAITKTLRFTILSRDGFQCVYCKAADKPLEVDHVRPVALGGADTPENLVAACSDCNGGKSAGHLANLDDFPRPNLMHDSVYIEKLENRIEGLVAERQKLIDQIDQGKEGHAVVRAQLKAANQKVQEWAQERRQFPPNLFEYHEKCHEKLSSENANLRRRLEKANTLITLASKTIDDYEDHLLALGGDLPSWRDERIEEATAMSM